MGAEAPRPALQAAAVMAADQFPVVTALEQFPARPVQAVDMAEALLAAGAVLLAVADTAAVVRLAVEAEHPAAVVTVEVAHRAVAERLEVDIPVGLRAVEWAQANTVVRTAAADRPHFTAC